MPGFELIDKSEYKQVSEVFLKSKTLFRMGFENLRKNVYKVKSFEKAFAKHMGSKYALAEGTPNVDDTLVNRLALQSRAAAFEPYGEDKVDDVHALYTDGGDLLIQATLVTTGKKYSDNAYQKMSNCNQYGFLDGYLRLIYMSKNDTTALADERREERDEAARTAADDL